MKRYIFLYIILGSFSFLLFSQTDQAESPVFIREKIETIKKIPAEKFLDEIDELHREVQKYFDIKKRVCFGEFSTVILREYEDDVGNQELEPRKLNEEEKKRCFKELKSLQVNYINNLYEARMKYLKTSHEKEIKNLKTSKNEALKSIQKTFSDQVE